MKKRWLLAVALLAAVNARAVILFNTADPAVNTTEPAGNLAGSGWQYEGDWGPFLGTPIAPHFFISAAHVFRPADVFKFQNATYTIVRSFGVPGTDLLVWQVVETFPSCAPLYTRNDEVGRPLVVIGRGTQRGSEVVVNNQLRGWCWGAGDNVRRWGENVVAQIISYGRGNDLLAATFDQAGVPNESHLSGGDSGGAVFLNDNGTWKLAGINYAVDGPLYTDANRSGGFTAALFDARGFYNCDGPQCGEITGDVPVPTAFYATRISTKLPVIYSIIDPLGDPDGDGIPNILEYAMNLDPLVPDVANAPKFEHAGETASLVYRKADAATDVNFAVEQSTDLVAWTTAQTQDEIISDTDGTQLIRATVNVGSATQFFLRLRVTRQ
ncbi:MAG: hypothetical protein ACJ8KU_09725 [Chthoniobacterales bacterium]